MVDSKNKIIAINTLFLYFRIMFTMLVYLYTSRVILQTLGVEDYGVFQVVGGVVSMLTFLNGALSTGSSRFLTLELGRGNMEKLKRTFCTTLTIHIFIALLIVIVAETVGLWFVCNKLEIPINRMNSALWVYHLSVLISAIIVTQAPYDALIIAHEKMSVYAFMSILEAVLKLGIAYLLLLCTYDKLILYAILFCIVQIGVALIYRFYCISRYEEAHYYFFIDKNILKDISHFSGWTIFANLAIALNTQGAAIITNMFFGPAIVTARSISIQVNMAANQFVDNFRMAINPQLVKRYAADNFNYKKLLLESTKYSYYLMFLLGLPIILLAEPLLKLWLGTVPPYSIVFLKLIIIQSLFSIFDTSFYTALYAQGRLRENAIISPLVGFLQFPVVYCLFKLGYSPIILSYAGIVTYALLGLVVKPVLIHKIGGFSIREIGNVFISCSKVSVCSVLLPIISFYFIEDGVVKYVIVCISTFVSVGISVFFLGISDTLRYMILVKIKSIIMRKKETK